MSADADALRLRTRLTELAETGQGDLRAVVGEFRRSEVLVPVVDGSVLSVEAGGVRWLFAFTDEAALERFARARGEAVPEGVPVYGARLLDQVVPRVARAGGPGRPVGPVGAVGPVGVAVDAGSAAGMVLPPVAGVVPAAVAVGAVVPDAVETDGEGAAGA